MNADTILTANLLDILFEGRNKNYGAYELRKSYNKRISMALGITFSLIAILIIGSSITNKYAIKEFTIRDISPTILTAIPTQPPIPKPTLPPPPAHVATIAFPPPLIIKDNRVVTPPPDIKQLMSAAIDLKTTKGTTDMDIVNPPLDITGTSVASVTPAKKDNADSVRINVQIEAAFPGGADAWRKYVQKAVEGNIDEFSEPDYGTCIVRFIVNRSGKVSDVEATTMKGSKLAEIAVNSIRKGPDWIPAQQNGTYVNAYRFQPVTLTNPN